MGVAIGAYLSKGDLDTLADIANSKTRITDYLTAHSQSTFAFGSSGWLDEFNRLRATVFAVAQANAPSAAGPDIPDWKLYVSGPWPITTNDKTEIGGPYRDMCFIHPDTGSVETLTVRNEGVGSSCDPSADFSSGSYTDLTFKIIIGGSGGPYKFKGRFNIGIGDPNNIFNATCTTDFPGATFAVLPGHSFNTQLYADVDDVDVSPGEYTFHVTAAGTTYIGSSPSIEIDPYGVTGGSGLAGATLKTSSQERESVPGIHNEKTLYKIIGPTEDPEIEYPFGIYFLNNIGVGGENVFVWQRVSYVSGSIFWTATTPGCFFGKTRPVTNLQMDQTDKMVWNIIGTSDTPPPIHAVYRSPAHEKNSIEDDEFEAWSASHSYSAGAKILDSNGNVQQANASMLSGATEPTWKTVIGGVTLDNTYGWTLVKFGLRPRQYSTPRYPTMRSSDVGSSTLNPENKWPYWDFFETEDWWIYRVNTNQLGAESNGIQVPGGTGITVDHGCFRAGSFVSFGSVGTGGGISAMWPVWTNNALAYQADERLDVQASIINPYRPAGFLHTMGAVTYPIHAAYYNDVEAILNLLS